MWSYRRSGGKHYNAPHKPQTDPYIDTPEEQERGSPTTEALKEIEPSPSTVTAQDPSLSSGATGILLLLGLFVLDSLTSLLDERLCVFCLLTCF